MRPGIVMILILAIGMCAAAATKTQNYSHFVKHRTRPREIRGFKPEYISTAIGFGKREGSVDTSKFDKRERILSTLLQKFPRGVPLEWLLKQMKTNPIFAARLTQLLKEGHENMFSVAAPDAEITVL